MNADPRVMEYFPALLSSAESDALIDRAEAHFDQHGFGPFALELRESGKFLGFIGLMVPSFAAPFTPCVEIGWRLAAEHWGQGYATEAAGAVLGYVFGGPDLDEIVSFTTDGNRRSRRVMERLGMTHDRADNFGHPKVAADSPLCAHVLYRMDRMRYERLHRGTSLSERLP